MIEVVNAINTGAGSMPYQQQDAMIKHAYMHCTKVMQPDLNILPQNMEGFCSLKKLLLLGVTITPYSIQPLLCYKHCPYTHVFLH